MNDFDEHNGVSSKYIIELKKRIILLEDIVRKCYNDLLSNPSNSELAGKYNNSLVDLATAKSRLEFVNVKVSNVDVVSIDKYINNDIYNADFD